MALETRVILRSALYNVITAKNQKLAIQAIKNMCDPEDVIIVNESVAEFLKENISVSDDVKK